MSVFSKTIDYLSGVLKLRRELEELKQNVSTPVVESKCKNRLIYDVNSGYVTVIDCDGSSYNGYVDKEVAEKLKTADTAEIIRLLSHKEEKVEENKIEQEEKEIVSNFLDVFEGVDDFEVRGNSVYFKGITSVEIPSLIVGRFIELISSINSLKEQSLSGYTTFDIENPLKLRLEQEVNSLKAFTLKLLLNPIQESREHALEFVRNFDIKMTNTGNLVMFRRILSKCNSNKDLIDFVSKQYLKVKSWKKSPKNYEVFDDNGLIIAQGDKRHDFNNHKGNLADLYNNLSELKENRYTDNHTQTYDIRIGATYKINDKDIDLNKNGSCGGSLHLADGKVFSYSSFGDTPVCCLVSPQHIYKMDSGCSGKIGVKQMFIAAITEQDEEGNYVDIDNQDLVNFDELYHNESIEELLEALKTKSLGVTSVSDAVSEVSLKEVQNITNLLKNRVINL